MTYDLHILEGEMSHLQNTNNDNSVAYDQDAKDRYVYKWINFLIIVIYHDKIKEKKSTFILCSNLSLKINSGVLIHNVHMIRSTINLFFVDPFYTAKHEWLAASSRGPQQHEACFAVGIRALRQQVVAHRSQELLTPALAQGP